MLSYQKEILKMTQMLEYFIPSADGVHQLHIRSWLPDTKVKAILQIAHGVAEHSERYNDFACFMAEKGFLVVANDHLGHGKSVKNDSELCFFAEEKGWEFAVQDVENLRKDTADKYPDLPYFMLGHSMGSFILRTHLIKYPSVFKAAIISGTGQMPPFMLKLAGFIGSNQKKKLGAKGHSDLIQKLAFGSYNKGFEPARTPFDWLTRDNAVVDKYISDPLCGFPFTTALFLDMMGGMEFIGKQENIEKMNKETPILFLSGDKDPVGGNGKQVKAVKEAFEKAGCKDITLQLYPEGRHEMLNELNKEEVYAFVYEFLKNKMK